MHRRHGAVPCRRCGTSEPFENLFGVLCKPRRGDDRGPGDKRREKVEHLPMKMEQRHHVETHIAACQAQRARDAQPSDLQEKPNSLGKICVRHAHLS